MIETRGLVHRYGESRAVDDVSLTLDDGAFVVVAGPNGSGKTTLVRHFNGLLTPDEGAVLVDGDDVTDHPVTARSSVAMVFQDPRECFVAATVGADVTFGPANLGLSHETIAERRQTALRAVRMDGREDERIDELSGGEQARVAIAGALAMEPTHLVLDEPFAGLDWPAREAVLDHLRRLEEGGTGVVVVTHDLRDVATAADRVVVLSEGRVALDGPPDAVADRLAEFGVRPPER
ncbi:energy-coupling factor ABC transporter ATP-binding protein [Halomarina oriensis]|uniref:ATP-binding cassette domain-containing protein n=1 Tax=Halomarina oriensis TaxID=671145 RepID=A0A6B0GHW6_9EURY|nr:ABC transporter ATP-binding protein [Halomarina oriensis]MWG34452.1 ATP-binding cassette domain-containing protein [Halomarina oriensis]